MSIEEYPNGGWYAYFSIGSKEFYGHIYDYRKFVRCFTTMIHPMRIEIMPVEDGVVKEDAIVYSATATALTKDILTYHIGRFINPF